MNPHITKPRLFRCYPNNSIYLTQPLFNACFYGLKFIFVLYLIHQLSLPETEAISIFATFMALSYATTLIGGYLTDRGLGIKNAVTLGGILTSLGLLCGLCSPLEVRWLGIALISLGSGFFKPNLLTAIGLMFENPKDPEKDKAYSVIYMLGNVGTFMLPALCGFIGKIYGWHLAVIFLAVIFIGATYVVHKTMRFHPSYKEPIPVFSQMKLWGIILLLVPILYLLFKYRESFHGMMGVIACGSVVYFGNILYQCSATERKDLLSVMAYILLFALFCTFFEQSGSSLLLFLEKAVDRQVMGIVWPSSTILSLGPLFVIVCGTILLPLCKRYLEKTKPLEGYIKMGWGFLFVALSFWILALGTYQDTLSSIPLLWVIGALFIQTLGELWIVPISLSKISQSAPQRFQSVMMSFWTMAIAYGHYFAGAIAQFSIGTEITPEGPLDHYRSFFFCLGLMPLVIGLLVILYQGIKSRAISGKQSA